MIERRPPKLRALSLPARGRLGARTIAYCPYCEEIHQHGASPGLRAAHCVLNGSPYRAVGYDLDCQGEARAISDVVPEALYARRRRKLSRAIEAAAPTTQEALLRSVLRMKPVDGRFEKQVGRARITFVGGAWVVDHSAFASTQPPRASTAWHSRILSGTGLIDLLAALSGLPLSMIAMRVLTAVTGERFDPQAWVEISAAIDGWVARRTEGRGVRGG